MSDPVFPLSATAQDSFANLFAPPSGTPFGAGVPAAPTAAVTPPAPAPPPLASMVAPAAPEQQGVGAQLGQMLPAVIASAIANARGNPVAAASMLGGFLRGMQLRQLEGLDAAERRRRRGEEAQRFLTNTLNAVGDLDDSELAQFEPLAVEIGKTVHGIDLAPLLRASRARKQKTKETTAATALRDEAVKTIERLEKLHGRRLWEDPDQFSVALGGERRSLRELLALANLDVRGPGGHLLKPESAALLAPTYSQIWPATANTFVGQMKVPVHTDGTVNLAEASLALQRLGVLTQPLSATEQRMARAQAIGDLRDKLIYAAGHPNELDPQTLIPAIRRYGLDPRVELANAARQAKVQALDLQQKERRADPRAVDDPELPRGVVNYLFQISRRKGYTLQQARDEVAAAWPELVKAHPHLDPLKVVDALNKFFTAPKGTTAFDARTILEQEP